MKPLERAKLRAKVARIRSKAKQPTQHQTRRPRPKRVDEDFLAALKAAAGPDLVKARAALAVLRARK